MKNKTTISIITLVVLIIIVIVVSSFTKPLPSRPSQDQNNQPNPTQPSQPAPTPITATFYSSDAQGHSTYVTAIFQNSSAGNSVTFTAPGLGTLNLPQVISASGARYANADESIVFWNKGNDVTIYQADKIIFQGSSDKNIGGPVNPPTSPKLPPGSTPPGNPALLIGETWVWQKSTMSDGSVVVPNNPGIFTLMFSSDGHVTGKTDCNGFGGTYQAGSDGVISFSPFASTLMYCAGSQEQVYDDTLAKVTRYSVDTKGNLSLILENSGGMMTYTAK